MHVAFGPARIATLALVVVAALAAFFAAVDKPLGGRAAVAEVARALGLTLDLLRVESLEAEVARLKLATPRGRRVGYGGP